MYTDGKRVPTLIRETTATKVKAPGEKSFKEVNKTSNSIQIKDHYPILSEPGGKYITHVTPVDGTGLALAKELVSVITERNLVIRDLVSDYLICGFKHKLTFRVIGMDGCAVNVGIHNGAIRLTELMVGEAFQHSICGLHLTELVFWHILSKVDGVTKGPESLSGPVGSTLHKDLWREPVVPFEPLPGKVELLSDEVVSDLSRDQLLVYRYAQAIQTGKVQN